MRTRRLTQYATILAFLVLTGGLLWYLVGQTGTRVEIGKDPYRIDVQLPTAVQLVPNSDVRASGVKVGAVTAVEREEDGTARVRIRIDHDGAHYRVTDFPVSPGAVQDPRPPIVVGGVGEKFTLPLVARYADVWNVPTYALDQLEHKISVLRGICADVGRDPDSIVMSVEAVLALAPDDAALPRVRELAEKRFGGTGFGLHDTNLIGTPATIAARLRALGDLGFGQVVLFTHDRASDTTLELLAGQVIPLLSD